MPLAVADYPNAAGVLLAWHVAANHNSRSPIAEIATVLTGEPWHLHYQDATKVVAAALRQSSPHGGRPS